MSEEQTHSFYGAGHGDTDAAIQSMLTERLSKMTSTERMRRFFLLYETARSFVLAGLHSRYPNCSEQEFKKRKAALFLGRDYALKTYGWDPESAGY